MEDEMTKEDLIIILYRLIRAMRQESISEIIVGRDGDVKFQFDPLEEFEP